MTLSSSKKTQSQLVSLIIPATASFFEEPGKNFTIYSAALSIDLKLKTSPPSSSTFSKKEDHLILEIKEYIENYIHKRSTGSATSSNLDEIRTLKELLDIGAITDEEFEAKKAQLLNL